MSDVIAVLTVEEVLEYLGIDYADKVITNNINRAIKTADFYLKGSLGTDYRVDDPRAKELALIIVSDLYDNRGLNETISGPTRKLVDDLSLQLRLETGGKTSSNDNGNSGNVSFNMPYIANNGNWYVWDTESNDYIDTGVSAKGIQGEKGDKGDTGATGEKGEKGDTGETGAKGADGADGYTPVKGVDYYTDDDKNELVELVLAALPNGDVVSY